jgi:cell division septation protein DedD
MPDLNLQDDGSMDNLESSNEHIEESTAPEEESEKQGGGGAKIVIIVLALLVVGGGGAFLLNKLGVIHIFGPKKAAPAVVQLQEQAPSQQAEAAAPAGDAGQTKMIETPPLDEKGKPAKKGAEKSAAKNAVKEKAQPAPKEMPAAAPSGKLQEMKGEYTIQVSAWRDKEIAEELSKRLADAGYPAYVEDRQYKDGTWYTVRVGKYPSRKEAEQAVQSFAEELRSSYWIDRARAK